MGVLQKLNPSVEIHCGAWRRPEESQLLKTMGDICAAINGAAGTVIVDEHHYLPPEPVVSSFTLHWARRNTSCGWNSGVQDPPFDLSSADGVTFHRTDDCACCTASWKPSRSVWITNLRARFGKMTFPRKR